MHTNFFTQNVNEFSMTNDLLLLLIYLTSVEQHANLDRRLEALAYLMLPSVPTRISRSTRQPQGLMNDCSIERHVNPNPRFDLTQAPLYIGLQACLKIGPTYLVTVSPDGIRNSHRSAIQPPFQQMHTTTSLLSENKIQSLRTSQSFPSTLNVQQSPFLITATENLSFLLSGSTFASNRSSSFGIQIFFVVMP